MTIAEKLSKAIQIPTIAYDDYARVDLGRLKEFQAYLLHAFPGVHAKLEREVISDFSLLYTWKGSRPELKPLLLLGHYDVVPPGDTDSWTRSPFGGEIADGFVWGRGALDDKASVICMMQAVENLLASGFSPVRSIMLALGGDEETSGQRGAANTARVLRERGLRFLFALDEGAAVIEKIFPGVNKPLALIGISEKGFANVRLSIRGEPGHSAMPPDRTCAGRIAREAARVEDRPFPSRIIPAVEKFLTGMAPLISGPQGKLFSHPRLASVLLRKAFLAKPSTAALVRTTLAVTMLSGSEKENVLPDTAAAVINVRVLPGDTVSSALRHIRASIKDPDVYADISGGASEPVTESLCEGAGWEWVSASAASACGDAIPVPYLVTAMTDSRHYRDLAENIYRFLPFQLGPEDLAGLHGKNEKISLENLENGLIFYTSLIRSAADGNH